MKGWVIELEYSLEVGIIIAAEKFYFSKQVRLS